MRFENVLALLLSFMIAGCASGPGVTGVSLNTPYGGGTASRVDSNREGSPSRLYGWDPSNRQVGSSIPTGR